MISLTGSGLNKRHQEFNTKVNEVAKSNVKFEDIRDQNEITDIDKLFKIDLASKFKNIDYILEVLKCGDSLHISRALKSEWLTDDEFTQFINPTYLERNLFPSMSLKMKKKLLTTICTRLRNCKRAEEFHHYCMRNKMFQLGMNFLLYTDETFKTEILTLHPHVYNDFDRNPEYVENFIGNSFLLAEYYLKVVANHSISTVLYKLRYLYSVSEDKYLDLLEKYISKEVYNFQSTSQKLSRHILKKHKDRVLKYPWSYVQTLDKTMLFKYSTSDDAKLYAIPFLPDTSNQFWYEDYYANNEFYLKLIPIGERYCFIKKIFNEKYPEVAFEEDFNFYTYRLFETMTDKQKEEWALNHIASGKELHGCGNDYIWYRFVNFQTAFVEIKKIILITSDKDKRADILNTLVESAKTEEELIILMVHYYTRHVNELKEHKREFIDKILEYHNVLLASDECWSSLDKILYSFDVYNNLNQECDDYKNNTFRALALTYYIIHEKSVPEVLRGFLLSRHVSTYGLRGEFEHRLNSAHLELIFRYLLSTFVAHVQSLISTKLNNEFDCDMIISLTDILDIIVHCNKTFNDIPENTREYIMREDIYEKLRHHSIFYRATPPEFGMSDIMGLLKKDSSLVISDFPKIRKYFEDNCNNINWLIHKIKVYFTHDIAPEYVKLLNECLSVEDLYLRVARIAVYGIFNLSNEQYKIDFLKKYAPAKDKIDHDEISRNLLTIQTAICSMACNSRPTLPLSSLQQYIKGDYTKYCFSVYDKYLANLLPAQLLKFVDFLLDNPLSIQKHGLRLAFHCFNTENLKNLVLKVWKQSKNVSLRKVIYKSLFEKVDYYHDKLPAQWELFGALNIMTLDLHQDDDDEVFSLLSRPLPPNVLGQHLQSAYIVVNTFPNRAINIQRLTAILEAMINNLELISKNILLAIMEDHITTMLEKDQILNKDLNSEQYDLIRTKWDLIKKVIIKHINLHIVYLITAFAKEKWYKTDSENQYVYRKFYTDFIRELEELSFEESYEHETDVNSVFRVILTEMEEAFPDIEMYLPVWSLKLNILTREVLCEHTIFISERYRCHDREMILGLVITCYEYFCSKVKSLMLEYLEKKKYFPFFTQDIINLVDYSTTQLKMILDQYLDDKVEDTNVFIMLCTTLLACDVREMYLFVMNYLPRDCAGKHHNEYVDCINKLKSLNDDEIKYFMCNKFYVSDHEHRNFMP